MGFQSPLESRPEFRERPKAKQGGKGVVSAGSFAEDSAPGCEGEAEGTVETPGE